MASCCPQFAGCAATAAMLPAILGGRSTAVFCCCRCFSARPVQAGDADDPTAAFVHGPDSAAGRPSAAATDNSAPPLCRLSCAAQPWQRTYTGIFLPIFSSPFGLLTALAVVASVDLVALLFVCQVSCAAASNRRGGAGGPGRPGRRGGPAACAAANTARDRGSSCSGGGQCRGAGRRRCGRAARRGGAGRASARRAARHLRRQVRRGPRAAAICEATAASLAGLLCASALGHLSWGLVRRSRAAGRMCLAERGSLFAAGSNSEWPHALRCRRAPGVGKQGVHRPPSA